MTGDAPLRLYLGAFTRSGIQRGKAEGISVVRFDPSASSLAVESVLALDGDPSWVCVSPRTGMAYAAAHTSRFEGQLGGALIALAIDPASGGLRRVNHQPVPFPHPNHLCEVGGHLLATSGLGGGITVLPLRDGGEIGEASFFIHGDGAAIIPFGRTMTSVPPFPANASFPHSVIADRSGRLAFVADLIRNRVDTYRLDASTGRLALAHSLVMHDSAGPRALAVHPTAPIAYVVNETDSTVSALRIDPSGARLAEIGRTTTRSGTRSSPNKAAAIAVHRDGRLLFVSNRGDDTIAILESDLEGELSRVGEAASCPTLCGAGRGDAHPRHIALTPDGRWLFAANTYADRLAVFAVEGRDLRPAGCLETPTPTCVAFAPPAG